MGECGNRYMAHITDLSNGERDPLYLWGCLVENTYLAYHSYSNDISQPPVEPPTMTVGGPPARKTSIITAAGSKEKGHPYYQMHPMSTAIPLGYRAARRHGKQEAEEALFNAAKPRDGGYMYATCIKPPPLGREQPSRVPPCTPQLPEGGI